LIIERVDSRTFNYPAVVGMQVESSHEVRGHSNGQVLLNMILSFSDGLRRVIMVCLPGSLQKLTEMRDFLPLLAKNIKIRGLPAC
jgi:hypothetical protein